MLFVLGKREEGKKGKMFPVEEKVGSLGYTILWFPFLFYFNNIFMHYFLQMAYEIFLVSSMTRAIPHGKDFLFNIKNLF